MDSPPSSEPSPSQSFSAVHVFALIILAGLLFLVNLGGLGLTDRDEGANAEAAREMVESGDWVSPSLNYEPRFAKPAFAYWMISGSYLIFGVNEFAARFPSAIFGVALILLQYSFLTRICGSTIALLGSLMLLLNIEVIGISRMVLTDPELVFFTTLSGYCFWLGMWQGGKNRFYFWGFYTGMGIAMLAKGPVGIIIPLLAVIPYLTVTRQWKQFVRIGYPLAGPLLVILIFAPWYLAMIAIHGDAYLIRAQAHTTSRFANPMDGHGGTILFYIPVLFLGFFPWSGFVPATLVHALKDWKRYRTGEHVTTKEEGLALFAALWIICLFLFFSLSASRLPHYIFPLFPAASILVALFWSRSLVGDSTPSGFTTSVRIVVTMGYLMGIALAAAPAIYGLFVEKIAKQVPAARELDLGLFPVALGVLIIGGTMLFRHLAYSAERRAAAFWVVGGMIGALVLSLLLFALPKANQYFIEPPQELATIAAFNLGPEDRLIQFGRKLTSLSFYAKRKVYQINPGEDVFFEPHVSAPGRTMIILQSNLRSRLPPPFKDFPVVLERHGFLLLSNESLLK